MTSLLTAENISISGRLEPTSLSAEAGQLIALVGPNGGGKTSLLRAIASVEDAQGRVLIEGEDLGQVAPNRRSRLVGFLPASRDIAWPISVRDLVRLGGNPDQGRVTTLLDTLELGALADRRVDQLSTGERARVLIARALAPRPRLLLLDEPLSNLDPYWVVRLLELLRRETATAQSTALVSLHDVRLADRFDRLLAVAHGSVKLNETPSNFLKSSDFEQIFRVRYQAL